MKRGIIGGIIFILIIAGVTAGIYSRMHTKAPVNQGTPGNPFAQSYQQISTPATASDPSTAAQGCYKLYVLAFEKNAKVTDSTSYNAMLDQCFTKSFSNSWSAFAEATGADPVLLAQDYNASWVTNQSATTLSNNGSTSQVQLTLGTGSEQTVLTVTMLLDGTSWKVNTATRSTGGK